MDSDLTPLNWLQNIDIMSQCGIDENPDRKGNGAATIVTIVDTTDYSTTNKKPPQSYSSLITKAIKSNPQNKMTLSQIYSWIRENYMYYSQAEPSWQNSIRHNLSLNKCFVKIPRGKDEPGKGGFWSLDESLVGRSGSKRKKKKKAKTVNGLGGCHHNDNNNENENLLLDNISDTTTTLNNNDIKISNNNTIINNNNNPNHCMEDTTSCFSLGSNNHENPFTDLTSAKLTNNLVLNGHIDDDSQGNHMSSLGDHHHHPNSNNNTIIVNHPEDSCIDICQDVFISSHEEIVESEIIESELILENVYWESVLDLDHLISMGEL